MTLPTTVKLGAPLTAHGKVGRMLQSLGRPFFSAQPEPEEPAGVVHVAEEAVTRAIAAWQERSAHLPGALLLDPAWRMLLELLQAEIQDRRVSFLGLCNVSGIPAPAAARWVKILEREALVLRRSDPSQPVEIVELSRKGSSAMRRYFQAIEKAAPPSDC
jgi:hypothetical protein